VAADVRFIILIVIVILIRFGNVSGIKITTRIRIKK